MLSKIDNEFDFIQNVMTLRARRQEILASNLANSDTPNYKARDIDFATALRSAMGGVGGPLALTTTSSGHIDGLSGGGSVMAGVKYRSVVQPSLDGNTVDPDIERAHFAENSLQYQFALERMRSTVEKLKSAMTENR